MSNPTMTQHLILHKVRGEAAFDIAEQMENGMWIIPTSGHRAYPAQHWPLEAITYLPLSTLTLPANLPDHYSINDRKPEPTTVTLVSSYTKPKRTPTLDDVD